MNRTRRRWAFVIVLAAGAIGWAVEPLARDRVDTARAAIEKMVETRRVISKEKHDWTLGREMLNERIDLVQREIQSLREKTAEAKASISDADAKRAELVAENDGLKATTATLGEIAGKLEARTLALVKRLPDPIRDRVKPLSQSIPQDPNDTKLSLSQRFQNVVGILDGVNKFNREITVTSEVRPLPDGTRAEVAAMYMGLGQAFYTGANGTVAGVGHPSEDGWTWEPANAAAQQIADAIAMYENKKVAEFVPLPTKVQ